MLQRTLNHPSIVIIDRGNLITVHGQEYTAVLPTEQGIMIDIGKAKHNDAIHLPLGEHF
ncbi:Uncharacterised protein [Vibrio cholerae]|nr:Uncharacterised protein [Vibrio cholerae]CSI56720.1 Uncharacterised protein [Vibrio cholerae]